MSQQTPVHNFYVSKYPLLIYETQTDALKCGDATAGDCNYPSNVVETIASLIARYAKEIVLNSVKFSIPNEPIFLLQKVRTEYCEDELWYVIIGNKIGWIIAKDRIVLECLKPELNNGTNTQI